MGTDLNDLTDGHNDLFADDSDLLSKDLCNTSTECVGQSVCGPLTMLQVE
jgi:hypothetical protein